MLHRRRRNKTFRRSRNRKRLSIRRLIGGDMMMPSTTPSTTSFLSNTQQTLGSVVDETKKDLSSLSGYFTNAYNYLTGSTTSTGGSKSKTKRRKRKSVR
jgi:hypothetical protein